MPESALGPWKMAASAGRVVCRSHGKRVEKETAEVTEGWASVWRFTSAETQAISANIP